MLSSNPRSTASLFGHPIHAMLVPIPITCFIGTFISDLVYWQTAAMQWANISAWLLSVGLIVSIFVAATGIIDFFGDRRIRTLRPAWIHALGNVTVVVLSIFNVFIHSRDAYTSVVPARSITTGRRASRRAPTGRSCMLALDPTATSPKTAYRKKGAARRSGRSTAGPAAIVSTPRDCATRTVCSLSHRRRFCGLSSMNAMSSALTWYLTILLQSKKMLSMAGLTATTANMSTPG
jgi:uncharacterized membrane protein